MKKPVEISVFGSDILDMSITINFRHSFLATFTTQERAEVAAVIAGLRTVRYGNARIREAVLVGFMPSSLQNFTDRPLKR